MLSSATWSTLGEQRACPSSAGAGGGAGGGRRSDPAVEGQGKGKAFSASRRRAAYRRFVESAPTVRASASPFEIALIALLRHGLEPSYAASPTDEELAAFAPLWEVPGIDVTAGGVPPRRAERKRQQVSNLCAAFERLLGEMGRGAGLVVIDFCASSGFVALPLAKLHPEHHFVVLDMSEASVRIAERRVAAAGLTNVVIVHGLIQDLPPSLRTFDVGIGLHACGVVTDLILERCIASRAAFLLCPCCVGKIAGGRSVRGASLHSGDGRIAGGDGSGSDSDDGDGSEGCFDVRSGGGGSEAYCTIIGQGAAANMPERRPCAEPRVPTAPRSRAVAQVLAQDRYFALARAADNNALARAADESARAGAAGGRVGKAHLRRLAKAFVEFDRAARAREAGYATAAFVLRPHTATPKNDVLYGWVAEEGRAERRDAAPPPAAAARDALSADRAEANALLRSSIARLLPRWLNGAPR